MKYRACPPQISTATRISKKIASYLFTNKAVPIKSYDLVGDRTLDPFSVGGMAKIDGLLL